MPAVALLWRSPAGSGTARAVAEVLRRATLTIALRIVL